MKDLRLTYRRAIVLVVISVVLIAIQAGVWVTATAHTKSETETENRIARHRPSEVAGLAGILLLLLTGTALSIEPFSPPRD